MNLLIQNASQILTAPDYPRRGGDMRQLTSLENASIYVRDGLIAAVGEMHQIEGSIVGELDILDAAGQTVIPGFVDSHTHLVFAGTREGEFVLRTQGASYHEITENGGGIVSTVQNTRQASQEELIDLALGRLRQALRLGTTTMEIKSGYGLDLENELKMLEVIEELNARQPIELVPTFLGAHGVPPGTSLPEYTEQVIAMLPQIAGKAEFCDVFCERGFFGLEETRAIFQAAGQAGLKLRMHADQLTSDGGVRLAVELQAASVDHLEKIGEAEIDLLAHSNTCATLLPGVSLFLNYGYPPARQLIDRGAIVALASNFNPGTCMCLNMQLVIALACSQMSMLPEEALAASTVNSAYSLNRPQVGRIAPGQQADLLILDMPNFHILPYYFGINHVKTVIKKGEIVA